MSVKPFVIKSCWLVGLSREDCAALLIIERVKSFGLVREKSIYDAVDAVYDTLSLQNSNPIDTYSCDPVRFIADSQRLDRRV